ncbi:bacterial seryl-tRNA synthetase related [Clostridiaceae bacterium JG1575]|nr:bacterial seryl-tRNA synthetase related [Clostridiaceae bacterium JG1575]
MKPKDQEVTYQIVKSLQVLSANDRGWTKEVNLVSWNGREPRIDIREWNHELNRMSKGMTLTREEATLLFKALQEHLEA